MIFFRNHIRVLVFFLLVISFNNAFPYLSDAQRFEISKQEDIFNAIFNELNLYYVDTLNVKGIIQNTITYLLQQLDPYTEYISSENLSDFQFQTTGQYGGIGAIISARDSQVIISEIYEGMPADLSGLKPGDEIVSINRESMRGKTSSFVSKHLKGQPNTKIKMEYFRPGTKKSQTITIERKRIQINPITYYGVINNDIGYICLASFTAQCALTFKKALMDLIKNQSINALVVDVRNNGGGLIDDCLEILNFFLPKGELLLSIKGKTLQMDKTYYAEQSPLEPNLPLAVLVNGNSASASEILSGTIQDTDRGIVVGSRTYGKGLVQSTHSLPYQGELKLTTAKYHIPSGRCIQAIDYTNKRKEEKDWMTSEISDTLTDTDMYYTAHHRPVRGGKGILPDFIVEEDTVSPIVYYLENHWMFLDFAIQWRTKHSSIGLPEDFVLTEETYREFKEFVQAHTKHPLDYSLKSEKIMESLQKMLKLEGYLEETKEEFQALEKKLKPDLEHDLNVHKKSVAKYLALNLLKYYYHTKGELIYQLRHDPMLNKAVEILKDRSLYRETLRH